MIPVLICPVLNRHDLLRRMLASVDEPVGRLLVVDMSAQPESVHPDALTLRPLISTGYPGAINLGIAQTPDAPWWLFASNDLVFGPGDLAQIARLMDEATGPRTVTGDRNDDRMLRWAYGAVNRATVEAVGLMDEWAFYPIYFDDDDYERRCRLAGVEWVTYNGTIAHDTSSTIRSDARASEANGRTFPKNRQRYLDKWGGAPGQEIYLTPYNLPGCPLSWVRPDPAGRADRLWETTMLPPGGEVR